MYIFPIIGTNSQKITDIPNIFEYGPINDRRYFSGSIFIPSSLITCPKYATSFCKSLHFLGLILRFAFLSLLNNSSKLLRCWEKSGANTIISSRYTIQVSHDKFDSSFSISLLKVAPALHKPKGITLKFQRPPPGIENVVLGLSSSATLTCKYPLFKSIVE